MNQHLWPGRKEGEGKVNVNCTMYILSCMGKDGYLNHGNRLLKYDRHYRRKQSKLKKYTECMFKEDGYEKKAKHVHVYVTE